MAPPENQTKVPSGTVTRRTSVRLSKPQAALNVLTRDKLREHTVVYTGELGAARDIANEEALSLRTQASKGSDDPATSAKLDVKSNIVAQLVALDVGGKKTRRCSSLQHASRIRG